MTPEQRQLVADLFQRLTGMNPREQQDELARLRTLNPEVWAELTRLLAADAPRATQSPGVSERLRAELEPAIRTPAQEDTVKLGGERRSLKPSPVEMVGPYRIVRHLGEGGLGFVLLAFREDDRFHKRVAIKLVKKGMDTDEILRRFEQERQVLSALNHPNIARVFDAGTTDDGRPYFVMEYVDGTPIDTYCDSQGLSTEERLRLFRKVCAAVHYAHQNLIVHRDIKPTNIMVTPDGEPKLLDFGIAKLLNPDLLFSPVTTGPEFRLMTPEYASPEQVEGLPITTSSDVYTLGVLLYQLLTGHPPYQLKSRLKEEIARVVCNIDPERPSTSITKAVEVRSADGTTKTVSPEEVARNRDAQVGKLRRRLAGDVDNIVLMAMRKKPPRRYKSAEQFAEDIDRHLNGMPVMARPETWVYVAGKFIRRNRLGLAALVAVFASLAGGLGVAAWQWSEAQARYEQVLKLARSHIDLQTQISDRVGSSAAQRVLVEASLPALDGLAKVARPDRALHDLLARGYSSLGGIERDSRDAGSLARSVEAFARALDQRRTIAASRPSDQSARVEVAMAVVDLARAQTAAGKKEAAATLKDALTTSADLLAIAPEDAGVRRLRAAARSLEGLELNRSAEPESAAKAKEAFEESVAILSLLKGAPGSDPKILAGQLAAALMDLGDWHKRSGSDADAEAKYTAAITALTSAVGASGESVHLQRELVRAHGKLGNLLINQAFEGRDRMDEALVHLNKGGLIAIRLANDDPLSESNALMLRRFYEGNGDAIFVLANGLAQQGKEAEAAVLFRKSFEFLKPFLEQTERAWQSDPAAPARIRALAVAREKVADVHRALDEHEPAVAQYRLAADLYRNSACLGDEAWRRVRSGICLISSGSVLEQLKRASEAVTAYRESIIDLEAGRADPENPAFVVYLLSVASRNLGSILLDQGDAQGAVQALTKARDTMEAKDRESHRILLYLGRAYALLTPPDDRNARTAWEGAIAAYHKQPDLTDDDRAWFMESCLLLGRLRARAGEVDEAKKLWREGLDAAAKLTAPDAEDRPKLRVELERELDAQIGTPR